MSEHIENYIGNQILHKTGSSTPLHTYNAGMGQNLVVGVTGNIDFVNIPTTLWKQGREISVTDYSGFATSADSKIVISGTDINGSTSFDINANYETVTLANTGTDVWVAKNTQT